MSSKSLRSAILVSSLGLAAFAQQSLPVTANPSSSQEVTPTSQTPVYRVQVVGRTTRALNYRNRSTTDIKFQGTCLEPIHDPIQIFADGLIAACQLAQRPQSIFSVIDRSQHAGT